MTASKARVFLIEVPKENLGLFMHPRQWLTPSAGAFYVGMIQEIPMIISVRAGKWSQAVPIIPELHKVWELPKGLEGLLEGGASPMDVEDN